MAALRISCAKPPNWGFTTALASAALEWLLILFLLVNALFSFIVTKFARYCKLQTPCLLCSRLDHVFGSEKLGYYWDLICSNHKMEVSSLVLCHAHNKLVDVRGMCESCLFSFATINKSNAETYRLLVGKLGEDTLCGSHEDPLLEGNKISCSNSRHCCCCNEPWVLKGHTPHLIQTKSVGRGANELDVPLSDVGGLNQDYLKMRREKSSVSVRVSNPRKRERDSLSHVGYTELKATSDTESEVLYSDDDASALFCETNVSNNGLAVRGAQLEPLIISLAENSAHENPLIADSAPVVSSSMSLVQLDPFEVNGSTSVESTVAVENGLEELNWQQANTKASYCAPTEADSKANPLATNDLISLNDVTSSSNATETMIEVSKESYPTGTGEVGQTSGAECGKIYDARTAPVTSSEIGLKTEAVSSDAAQQEPNSLDLGDAYKIAVGDRGQQFSGVLLEQRVGKNSSRVSEDLKLLLSQLSASRGIEQSMNEKSPRFSVTSDELKTTDASYSHGMQILQKRISLERNDSGVSLDGSALQKRISLERKDSGLTLDGSTLQKRISLERNESGLSLDARMLPKRMSLERNESGLSLDGSVVSEIEGGEGSTPYGSLAVLRLMEEQSQYDTKALQNAYDLLAEKEKEMQDLEAELEFYRTTFPNESILENVIEETCDMKAKDIGMDHSESVQVSSKTWLLKNIRCTIQFKEQNLEKKLYLISNNAVYLENGDYPLKGGQDVRSEFEDASSKEGTRENRAVEEENLSMQQVESVSSANLHAQVSFKKAQLICEDISELDSSGQGFLVLHRGTDLASIGNEVSNLNGRLEALEADKIFLEHSINLVKNGEEGLQLIREIASHLREFRRIGLRTMD
ncbi:hypothetical protein CJ030_MR8G002217 [Morella rubra]|uniref:GTD-binding domain-containing protein n=1 Tax=Morella rubra TaxID=262757 RepID=A0A6A1USG0_9ROSI|nr:hypothetical protein CJ030_MR8G002217 [Morella rubra]